MESAEIQPREMPGKILAWLLSVLVSLGCVLVCFFLYITTGTFGTLFNGLGVDLPLPTKLLIANYRWLYPFLFGGIAVLLIAKEFVVRSSQRRMAITGIFFVIAILALELVRYVLYLPLFVLIEKLNQAK